MRTGEIPCWTRSRFLGFVLMLLAVSESRLFCSHTINLLYCWTCGDLALDSTLLHLFYCKSMHHESERERNVKMMDCKCNPVCIKSALLNTKARSDCTDAVSLCLRDSITKKLSGAVSPFMCSLWSLHYLIVNWSQKLLANFGGLGGFLRFLFFFFFFSGKYFNLY